MIKLSKNCILKVETGQKLGLLPQTVSQAVNAKGKFSREIKSVTQVITLMVRNQNSFIADMEKVLNGLERGSNQSQHSPKPEPDVEQKPAAAAAKLL